jgi:hypothetical protein
MERDIQVRGVRRDVLDEQKLAYALLLLAQSRKAPAGKESATPRQEVA